MSEKNRKNKTGKEKKKSGKTFNIRECPKCGSDEVAIVVKGEFDDEDSEKDDSKSVMWECKKCKWKGTDVVKKELTEDELLEYMEGKE